MIKKIKVEIYKTSIWLYIESNKDKVRKTFKKYNLKYNDDAMGSCHSPEGYPPFVWVKNLKDISTLCHEITHACYAILDHHGVEVDADNHEALTYLQTFLLEKILIK